MEDCKIELIELCPCNSKEELLRREGDIIQSIPCVNKQIAGRTRKEYSQTPRCKEYYKKYRIDHIERCNNYDKEYRQLHGEQLSKQRAEQKECDKCGCSVRCNEMLRHQRTKKCQLLSAGVVVEPILAKNVCSVCGSCVSRIHLNRHQESKRCQEHKT